MGMDYLKRGGSAGYIIRDPKSGSFAEQKGAGGMREVTRLPDGKLIRSVDRDLFDRAIRAANKHKN